VSPVDPQGVFELTVVRLDVGAQRVKALVVGIGWRDQPVVLRAVDTSLVVIVSGTAARRGDI